MSRTGKPLMATSAFTLVELLVVVAIIAILMGMLLPALASARESARKALCLSNLKQIGMGMEMYTSEWNGFFPVVHGGTYGSPEPPACEWWEYLHPHGFERNYMLCRSDPHCNNTNIESYILNGMFAFGKNNNRLRKPDEKVIVSERADEGSALVHQGYPAWKDRCDNDTAVPPTLGWEGFICKERHGKLSNYLFADGHAAGMVFDATVGDTAADRSMHFIGPFHSESDFPGHPYPGLPVH